jgi:DNA-binding transcriptional LysR family regulator
LNDIVDMPNPSETGPVRLPSSDGATPAPQGVELRHLRYFVAAADAGTLTRAAEQILIAQPTLSQQIRRLEEMVGTPLLQRRRDGLRLTAAGSVLLQEARTVLSLVDHSVSRARQVAGLPRLRVIIPPHLPEGLAVETASRLRGAADAAGVDVAWMETSFAFSLIREHRAHAGLCWLPPAGESLPARIDAMNLGEFELDVWIPSAHPTARHGTISLDDLARMIVISGPPRIWSVMYDAWLGVLRAANPRFEFTDPPFRNTLPSPWPSPHRETSRQLCSQARSVLSQRADRPSYSEGPIPTTWFASASNNPRWSRRQAWCGVAIYHASCSRSCSTQRTV